MKKKPIILIAAVSALTLAGCQEPKIEYNGQLMPVSEAEERIADELEVENPDLDLEVMISEESDD